MLLLFSSTEIFMFPTRFVRVTPTAWPLCIVVRHNNCVPRLDATHSKIFDLKKIGLLGQEGRARRVIIVIINNGCLAQELPGNHCRHKGKQTESLTHTHYLLDLDVHTHRPGLIWRANEAHPKSHSHVRSPVSQHQTATSGDTR